MTRVSAVHFLCTPGDVNAFIGHNPGVFSPLTRSHSGDRVHYQHDGADEVFVISEIHRVSPSEAAAYSQDGSYRHAVLATCAEPDSSSYWVFIALPESAPRPAPAQAGTAPGGGGNGGGPPSRPAPTPTPAPSPSPHSLPGGVTLPPPPAP